MENEMLVYSGNQFALEDYSNYPFPIEEIAHALSMLCRFNGHTKEFYSVAQHSVIVANSLQAELQLYGLLHDAAEAYLGDIVRPLKKLPLMNYYHQLEERMLATILFKHGVFWSREAEEAVDKTDNAVLTVELNDLFNNRLPGLGYGKITPVGPQEAKEMFLSAYKVIKCQD